MSQEADGLSSTCNKYEQINVLRTNMRQKTWLSWLEAFQCLMGHPVKLVRPLFEPDCILVRNQRVQYHAEHGTLMKDPIT